MAAKTLDEILLTLSGPEKALFDNTLKNNPELKDGWLRQDDYSRRQTELASKKAEQDEAIAYSERMKVWADENVPRFEALQTKGIIGEDGEELWTAKEAEYQRQLEAARAAAVGGEDMDPAVLKANIQAILKDYGPISKDEMTALAQAEARKLAGETFDTKYAEKEAHFNDKTIPFVTGFSTSMALAAAKYERETGKEFSVEDQQAVFALMTRDKNYDPRKVVAEYMAPELKKKADDAEVERRVQERLAQERGTRGGMPGGGDEPFIPQSSQKGNLQLMMEREAGPTDIESLVTAAAVKASTELRTEGKV